MRRAIAIAAALIAALTPVHAEMLSLSAEYRRDAVDYDESVSEFCRVKTEYHLSQDSSFIAAAVLPVGTGESTCTWNLSLDDVSPHISMMFGNFYARFGGGLVLGKRNPFDPDALSRRSSCDLDIAFSPAVSGNPLYTFYGIALSAGAEEHVPGLRLNAFWSSALRYMDAEGYFAGTTTTSLATIRSSERSARKTEPVYLNNAGLNLVHVFQGNFLAEISWLVTALEKPSGGAIAWDAGARGRSYAATRCVNNLELFTEYRDDFLRLSFEPALSIASRRTTGGADSFLGGHAYLARMALKSAFMETSLVRKHTAPLYYAPWSASLGEQYPERAWFFDVVFPRDYFSAGASLSSEKKLRPDAGDDEMPLTMKEELFLEARRSMLEGSRLSFRMLTRHADGNVSRVRQGASRVKSKFTEWLTAGLGAVYQARDGQRDAMLGSGTVSMSLRPAVLTAAYCRAIAPRGNPLYTVIAPAEQSSIPGMTIRASAHIIVGRISFKSGRSGLNVRSLHLFTDGAPVRHTVELAGRTEL
jgi:hypothetical protein